MVALNDLNILSGDHIGSTTCLNALPPPTNEKIWFHPGDEFGSQQAGCPVIIVRALYGLKVSAYA